MGQTISISGVPALGPDTRLVTCVILTAHVNLTDLNCSASGPGREKQRGWEVGVGVVFFCIDSKQPSVHNVFR